MLVTYIDKDRKSSTYFLEAVAGSNHRFAYLTEYRLCIRLTTRAFVVVVVVGGGGGLVNTVVLDVFGVLALFLLVSCCCCPFHSLCSGSADLVSRLSYATDVVEHLITMGRQRPGSQAPAKTSTA